MTFVPERLFFTALLVLTLLSPAASAVVLEGTGLAVIRAGNIDAAREEARKAALRDVSMQYEAHISSEDIMESGVVTDSRLTVTSRARARDVQILDERQLGNSLRITLRAEMSEGVGDCHAGDAAQLKKRVAVTGFILEHPHQARHGRLDDAGLMLPQILRAGLQAEDNVQVLSASTVQLFDNVTNAPTSQRFDNRLTNVIQVARELGAQFVVAGVIRDLGMADPAAWGSSVLDKLNRSLGTASRNRRFVVDLMIFDGFSGSPIYQKRFQTEGLWDGRQGTSVGFGSVGFQETDFGQQVGQVIDQMGLDVREALACQPFMTRITRVEGQKVTLASGATAGLRPGDTLSLYRSYSHFDSPGATPELMDADIEVTLDNIHPEFSNGQIPEFGALQNIQRGDIAIIW